MITGVQGQCTDMLNVCVPVLCLGWGRNLRHSAIRAKVYYHRRGAAVWAEHPKQEYIMYPCCFCFKIMRSLEYSTSSIPELCCQFLKSCLRQKQSYWEFKVLRKLNHTTCQILTQKHPLNLLGILK